MSDFFYARRQAAHQLPVKIKKHNPISTWGQFVATRKTPRRHPVHELAGLSSPPRHPRPTGAAARNFKADRTPWRGPSKVRLLKKIASERGLV